jgi:Flp pilus assembly protein TadG
VTLAARFRRLCRRLKADGIKGSAAIEFAMVAPVFFVLLMGTIEAGVIFFAQSALQNALNDTARLVRTGQTGCYTTDSGGNCVAMTQAQFRTKLCSEVSLLLQDCNGASLQFDVQAYPSGFSSVSNSSPLVGGTLPTLTAFNVGNACDVVLARAFYKWPVFTPGLGYFLANVGTSYHLLASAAAFRNEPFTAAAGGGCS